MVMKENNLKIKKLINFGPSGRAVAQPIDKNLLDNIFEHLTMERYQQKKQFCLQDSIQQTLRLWKIWIYQ